METYKNVPSAMIEKLDWICAEIKKTKDFQAVVGSKITKLESTNTTIFQPVQLTTLNELDMTPRQSQGMVTTNKCVATSLQRQQCDLMAAGNKDDCFVFDLFKNRISQLQKPTSKNDEIINFLTEELSAENAFTIPSNSMRNQSKEKRNANKNPLLSY